LDLAAISKGGGVVQLIAGKFFGSAVQRVHFQRPSTARFRFGTADTKREKGKVERRNLPFLAGQ
jgi:hypothetical protein